MAQISFSDRFVWFVGLCALVMLAMVLMYAVPVNQVSDSTGRQVVPATAAPPVVYGGGS